MAQNFWNIFEKTSQRFGGDKAIILFENSVYTIYSYNQLFEIINELYIILSETITAGEIIGICMEHDFLIPVLLAVIHRFNCSFIFFDKNEHDYRQKKTIADLNILTIFSAFDNIKYSDFSCKEIPSIGSKLNRTLHLWTKNDGSHKNISIYNFAYFIKTSGSTSLAKNVAVTHKSIFPNIDDFKTIFNVTSKDVIYFSTPLTFDPSIVEIYLAAYCGAALLISKPYTNILFPKNHDYSVTIWQTTPSKLMQLGVDEIKNSILSSMSKLRVLALGGEPFIVYDALLKLKHKQNTTEVYNLYGITEVSCWSSVSKIDFVNPCKNADISIGHSLSHSSLQIMDDNMRPIICGTGNIYLGSHTRKCLVGEEAAVNSSYECSKILENNEMLWRNTGDIGEIKNDGLIYFKGRNDTVIKRFGSKISLLEIETIGLEFFGVEQCICLWITDSHTLIMFYTTKLKDIRDLFLQYLQKSLTAIQMPDNLIQLQQMPLSDHGKICKKKILDDFKRNITNIEQTPKDAVDLLRKLLLEALSLENLESKQKNSFIQLGGNSVMAIQLVNKFEKSTGKHHTHLFPALLNDAIPLSSLFDLSKIDYTDIKSTLKMSNGRLHNDSTAISISQPMKKKRLTYPEAIIYPNSTDFPSYSLEVAWKIDLSKCVDASPVLYRIREMLCVIVGSHSGKVAVINALSGVVINIFNVSSRVEAPVLCFTNGHSEQCAVVGDYSGFVWCFSLLDGKMIWKASLDAMIKSQACHINSNIYIASYKGIVSRIDEMSGQIVSSIVIANSGITSDLLLSRSGLIFVASLNGTCACIETNTAALNIVWKRDLSSPVFTKPTFLQNEHRVVFSEVNGVLHCLDSSSGDTIWTFATANGGLIFSSSLVMLLAEREYLVFGCHDHCTYQLAVDEKQKNYPIVQNKIKQTSEVYAAPHHLKNIGIVSISTDGHLTIIDDRSGNIKASHKLQGNVFSSPTASDDSVYVGCRDNHVYCLRITERNKY